MKKRKTERSGSDRRDQEGGPASLGCANRSEEAARRLKIERLNEDVREIYRRFELASYRTFIYNNVCDVIDGRSEMTYEVALFIRDKPMEYHINCIMIFEDKMEDIEIEEAMEYLAENPQRVLDMIKSKDDRREE